MRPLIVSDGAAQMATVTGLTSGVNYLGIVVALQGTGDDQTFYVWWRPAFKPFSKIANPQTKHPGVCFNP